jgi:hypothetical protein
LFSLDGIALTVSLDPPRDRFEFWVRFGFGAVFGPILGLIFVWWILPDIAMSWLVALCAAVFFGLAAAFSGDRFWHFLLGLFRWW